MSLWLILVNLSATFLRILCCTSIWTRFMKNRITHTEPDPNEVICDIDTKDDSCGNDSCNSSIITNKPQSEIFNRSSVPCEENEKCNEDEFYSSMNKQSVIVANIFGDETKLKSDDIIYVPAHQTSTTSLPQKAVTTDKMIVNRRSSSILTKYKNANFSETNTNISDCISGDEITNEEFADKITDSEEESGDKSSEEESGDKSSEEESGDKSSEEESGEKITDEVDEESSDKITGQKFDDQTTDMVDTNNCESNNKISDHECYSDSKNVIDEYLNTSNRTILSENSGEIDVCQRSFKRYFVYENNEILDVENFGAYGNLDIPEDKSDQIYVDFLISTTNEMAECEFYREIKNRVSVITHENSGDCLPNKLKPDVCETNDSYKCSLDIIPLEFIYPCLPYSRLHC